MAEMPALLDGETVLWEGKPDTGLRFGIETMATSIFAAALVLACLGMATVIDRSMPGTYWIILGPGLVLGVIIALVAPLRDRRSRARTAYCLTNRRAIILIGQTAQNYAIPPKDAIRLLRASPPSVLFARGPGNHLIGFERIADGIKVYDLMTAVSQSPDEMTPPPKSAKDPT